MNDINTGGPAFLQSGMTPHPGSGARIATESGMTLRDYFAAKGVVLIEADDMSSVGEICEFLEIDVASYRWREHWPIYIAQRAYAVADAMLKVRGQS